MAPPTFRLVRLLTRYGAAVLATAAAFLLRQAVAGSVGPGFPTYIAFYPTVMLVALLAGCGPGLLATAASAGLAGFWILPPQGQVAIGSPADAVGLALFSGVGIGMSVVARLYHAARRRAAGAERDLAVQAAQAQAAAETERQRQLQAVTLASIADAVIVTDTRSRITFLNGEAERLTGWRGADAVGQPLAAVFRIVGEETRQPAADPAQEVLQRGAVVARGDHTVLIARDGRETPIDDSAAPVRQADGTVHGVVLVFRDVTRRRRAAEALQRYGLLAAHSRDIILFVRRDDGRLLETNPTAAHAYGYTREELRALTIHDLRAPDSGRLTATQMAQADAQGLLFEAVHRRKDGTTFPVEVSARGATIGGMRTLVSVVRDITGRREAEAALRTRTAQLEVLREVGIELTRELDLQVLLRLILDRAMRLLQTRSGTVFLWDEAIQRLVVGAHTGLGAWYGDVRHPLGEGVVGTVAQRRAGLIVNDYPTSPYVVPQLQQHTGVQTAVCEPLLYRERLIGTIILRDKESGAPFQEADLQLLRLLADQATIAIENARLLQEERARWTQLETVRALTAELTQELDLGTLLRLLVRRAIDLFGGASGTVYLWNEADGWLVPNAWYGLGEWMGEFRARLGEGLAGKVAAEQTGMILNEYRASALPHPVFRERTAITATILEPLLYRGRLLGVITVNHAAAGRLFTPEDARLLRLFADQAAIAIANARLYADAAERATELEALQEIGQAITRQLEPAAVLAAVVSGAIQLVGSDFAQIVLWDPVIQRLRFGAAQGPEAERVRSQTFELGRGITGVVAQTRQPMILDDYQASAYAVPECVDVVATLTVPICFGDRLLGVLHSHTTQPGKRYTAGDLRRFQLLATQAAIALENARLFAELGQSYRDLQTAQAELVRAEKLRALGQMSAGIAHDLNNMLAAILGQAELLRLRTRDPALLEALAVLDTAAADGAEVVRRIQDFARQRPGGGLVSTPLPPLVHEALGITQPRWKGEAERRGTVIRIETALDGLPPVLGRAPEIREALTNLIINAIDAMPEGGTLRITGASTAEAVDLVVTDSGVGMPEEVRRQIFNPFFTTKGVRGTGLGLSVVYSIMERHGGSVAVTSSPGQGSAFTLRFRPASPESAPPPVGSTRQVPPLRLLLIEDDPAVRQTIATLLRTAGHTVLEAEDGTGGLGVLAAEPVDLVLTDLGMPDMSGWEVAHAIKAERPALPVVLLTGWGEGVTPDASREKGVDRILGKPVRLGELLQAIAALCPIGDPRA